MMSFALLAHPLKSVLLTVLFVTVCISIYLIPCVYRRKSKFLRVLVPASALLCGAMLVLYDAHVKCFKPGWTRYEPVERFAQIPLIFTLPLFALVVVILGVAIHEELQYRRSSITHTAIKESLDHLTTGLCFAHPNGRIMLVNHRMNEICHAVTGIDLQNANILWNSLSDGQVQPEITCLSTGKHPSFRLPDSSVWTFSREHIDGILQYTAAETTQLYDLTEELEAKNIALAAMNLRLRRHSENIEALTRDQEHLETKARIHRELGRSLLSTRHYLTEGSTDTKEILSMWKRNVAMLRLEPEVSGEDHPFDMLLKVAEFAGIRVDIDGQIPKQADAQHLFFDAASEALTNAVSHANAKTLWIRFNDTHHTHSVRFTNDGDRIAGSIIEGGGTVPCARRQSCSVAAWKS